MKNKFIIEVFDLQKHYGPPEKRITAVSSISFKIEVGTVFGLLGPNGAGKTTTIKILTTLTMPDSGRCVIDGFDVVNDPMEIKRRIGVVPQENNLDRELTAYENLLIYGMLHNVKNLKEKIEEKLRMVGLWERKDSLVSHFSGGMQRRLLFARALLPEPSILFLDEPTIGLDPQIRRQLWDVIRKTRIDGRTVVLTTHYIEEAEALCDRIGILAKGRLIALDTPSNLKKLVGEYVVDVIDDEGRLMQYMFKTRDEAHQKAMELQNGVTIRRSNLEDVFVKLTGGRIE
ncbi:ABC transporter ATP-binding protein [Dissulfurispira thermophila]|uniref:ABC transporter ATP-binding protein n=1 Tax=Dissulfurispira thermophila TaxID=2715679 RepID=A0A7G1H075_9BACT|nr:ATP-binding cassette domain-containing protein [Dissulfurispira thermophila]BCB95948.1 ABC transporter ATP-binding protein [Dissulfurispira thermophila]